MSVPQSRFFLEQSRLPGGDGKTLLALLDGKAIFSDLDHQSDLNSFAKGITRVLTIRGFRNRVLT